MINFNGNIVSVNDTDITIDNRGYKYGDALFETIRVLNNKVLFLEQHYFRLMSSMRILRMEIPMNFTMEFFESEILRTINANNFNSKSVRIRFNVDRGEGGKYKPENKKQINYSIIAEPLQDEIYFIKKEHSCIVELYKDFYIAPGLLSTLKSNNKVINVLGSIYAEENGYDNCLLLNTDKKIIESLNGNLFVVKGDTIKTAPLEDGCLKGVMRHKILEILSKDVNLYIEESSISPFELQKADEMFITNVIQGIVPITKYRKKEYSTDFSRKLLAKLNAQIRLGSN